MQRISGASGRLTISTLRPFGSVRSITWPVRLTSCAAAGASPASRQQEQAETDDESMSHVHYSVNGKVKVCRLVGEGGPE